MFCHSLIQKSKKWNISTRILLVLCNILKMMKFIILRFEYEQWCRFGGCKPPEGAGCRMEAVTGTDAAELLPTGVEARPISGKVKSRVRLLPGKPAKIPRKAAVPPA
jgi:hypothetical protein